MAFFETFDLEEDLDEELIHDQFILQPAPTVMLFDDYFAPDDEIDEELLLDGFFLIPAPTVVLYDDYWLVEDEIEEELLIDSSYVQIPALVVISGDDSWPIDDEPDDEINAVDNFTIALTAISLPLFFDDAWPYVEDVDEELPLKDDFVSASVIVPVVSLITGGGIPRLEFWDTRKGKQKLKDIEKVVKAEFKAITGNIPAQSQVTKVVNQVKDDDLSIINAQLSVLKAQIKQLVQDEQDEEDVMILMMGFM